MLRITALAGLLVVLILSHATAADISVVSSSAVLSPSGVDQTFGWSVDMDENKAVVGAPTDGINGASSGSAYVFTKGANGWIFEQKLKASDGAPNDLFGTAVAIDGNTIVVGAPFDDSAAGAAYIFEFDGSKWQERQPRLTATDRAPGDLFSYSLSISGDSVLVGAYADDPHGESSGSAYVFARHGGVWTQQQKLTVDDGQPSDFFGWSVSISGNTAMVGADHGDANGTSSGAVYVFDRSGSTWSDDPIELVGDAVASNHLGSSIDLDGDRALVGARGGPYGAVHVFERNQSGWSQVAKLTTTNVNGVIGQTVSLSGDVAVVGAADDNVLGVASGSALIFQHLDSGWIERGKLTASDGQAYDQFGSAVSVSQSDVLVGAFGDDGNDGSVYAFKNYWSYPVALSLPFLDDQTWEVLCGGSPHGWEPCGSTSGILSFVDLRPEGYGSDCNKPEHPEDGDEFFVRPAGPGKLVDPVAAGIWLPGNPNIAHTVVIDHAPIPLYTVYFHLIDKTSLPPDMPVNRSTKLGRPSCQGGSSGWIPHVHFGVRDPSGKWLSIAETITLCGWSIAESPPYFLRNGTPPSQPNNRVSCKSPADSEIDRVVTHLAQGETQGFPFLVSPGQVQLTAYEGHNGSQVDIWLTAPDGAEITPVTGVYHVKGLTYEYYEIPNPLPGTWTVHAYGAELPLGGEDVSLIIGSCSEPVSNAAGSPCSSDDDGDGLTDQSEIEYFTNPIWADTDNDTLSDGDEITLYGTDPLSADPDFDTFIDPRELYIGTNPHKGCGLLPGSGTPSENWPADLVENNMITISDVLALKPVFNTPVPPTSTRYDLVPSGTITISDVLALKPVFNTSCTP